MLQEILLDTKELEAPEPMGLVLLNLSLVNETTYIKMIHRLEPLMLYTHLTSNNFQYKKLIKNEDTVIYIWDSSFEDKKYLEELCRCL